MNKHNTINIIKRLNKGESKKSIKKEIEIIGKARAKEKGKKWGKCESCGDTTVLVKEVCLCGLCCFGESETYNGNW